MTATRPREFGRKAQARRGSSHISRSYRRHAGQTISDRDRAAAPASGYAGWRDLSRCGRQSLRDEEGAAPVDGMHQVVALMAGVSSVGVKRDGRSIIDADVDAAERLDRLSDGLRRSASRREYRRRAAALARRLPRSPRRPYGSCLRASDAASTVLAAMAILAPSRAARSAIARPMPRDAPVMKRVLPLSDGGLSMLL